MELRHLEDILKMRLAVYLAGVKSNFWQSIDFSVKDYMNYIFPKSDRLAFYNIVLEFMHSEHKEISGSAYYLFKLPVHVEKELSEILKTDNCDFLSEVYDSPEEYLKKMDIITTDHMFGPVNTGKYSSETIDIHLQLCAAHYRYAFDNNVKSFPFFE